MMSNVLDAIKEGQKASQEVAKQVEELAQLRSSDILFQSQRDDTCSTLAVLTREKAVDGVRNVLFFKDGTILMDGVVFDLQNLIDIIVEYKEKYIVWKQL